MIAITGWQNITAISIFDFIEDYISKGIKTVICTDITKDGMLQGSSIFLYKELLKVFPKLKLIASGGITSIDELNTLNMKGIYGAIIGKAIYEGKITLKQLSGYVSKKNSSLPRCYER